MIEFEYRDIRVDAVVKMMRSDYKDANNVGRTRFDRNIIVVVQFWDFAIFGDLYQLATVKSTLAYFMQCYWKRHSQQGKKIDLSTSLCGGDPPQVLNFVAKQKNNIYYLEISITQDGQPLASMYLNGQEVMLVDIAISKAIAVLTPREPRLTVDTVQ